MFFTVFLVQSPNFAGKPCPAAKCWDNRNLFFYPTLIFYLLRLLEKIVKHEKINHSDFYMILILRASTENVHLLRFLHDFYLKFFKLLISQMKFYLEMVKSALFIFRLSFFLEIYLMKMAKLDRLIASVSKAYLSEKLESLDWRSMVAVSFGVGAVPPGRMTKNYLLYTEILYDILHAVIYFYCIYTRPRTQR